MWQIQFAEETELVIADAFIRIITDNFCIVLFSDVHKLTALYNTLQHL